MSLNLNEKDRVTISYKSLFASPECLELEIISRKHFETKSFISKIKEDGCGWLIIDTDLFKIINSMKLLDIYRTMEYPELFVLEIERYKKPNIFKRLWNWEYLKMF